MRVTRARLTQSNPADVAELVDARDLKVPYVYRSGRGGIGRRNGLKTRSSEWDMWVRLPPPAPRLGRLLLCGQKRPVAFAERCLLSAICRFGNVYCAGATAGTRSIRQAGLGKARRDLAYVCRVAEWQPSHMLGEGVLRIDLLQLSPDPPGFVDLTEMPEC